VLYVVTLVLTLGYGAIFALLAELQDEFGLPDWGLGIIAGSTFLAGLVAQVGLARFADRGHARVLMLSGVAVAGLGVLWLAFATEVWEFAGGRTLLGLGQGAFLPAARRIIVTRDPASAGAGLGRLSSAEIGGFLLGPPIAAVIADALGLRAPFVFLAVLIGITAPFVLLVEVPEGMVAREGPVVRSLLRRPTIRAGLMLGGALYLAYGLFEAIWARYLSDLGASTLFIGITLTLYGLPVVILAPVAGKLADRYGAFTTAVVCVTLTSAFVVLYGWFDVLAVLTTIALVNAIVDAGATPATQAAVAVASPPDQVAAGQGLLEAVGLAFAGFAALAAVPLYAATGPEVLFTLSSAVMVTFCLAAHLTMPRRFDRTAPTSAASTR
jgi:MFS family permease